MPIDTVADEEELYRRIPNQQGNTRVENGIRRATSAAFGDRHKMQPSVDRAKLRGNNPQNSCQNADDRIACLIAADVRSKIGPQVQREIGGVKQECKVDVIPDPLGDHCSLKDRSEQPENLAHAVVCAVPNFQPNEKRIFEEKFRRALARLSKLIFPKEE